MKENGSGRENIGRERTEKAPKESPAGRSNENGRGQREGRDRQGSGREKGAGREPRSGIREHAGERAGRNDGKGSRTTEKAARDNQPKHDKSKNIAEKRSEKNKSKEERARNRSDFAKKLDEAAQNGERVCKAIGYRDDKSGGTFGFGTEAVAGTCDMIRNYNEMKSKGLPDKFAHCNGNCEASTRGAGGTAAALAIDVAREVTDIVRKSGENGAKEQIKDSMRDMAANFRGMAGGVLGMRCSEVCSGYRVRKAGN